MSSLTIIDGLPDLDRLDSIDASLPKPMEALSEHLRWLLVLRDGLGHTPILVEAQRDAETIACLPLCLLRSPLFGRHLVSLPYLNYGGVRGDLTAATALTSRAVELADQFAVKNLSLRNQLPLEHDALAASMDSKVHMRLELPATTDQLWDSFKAKVRNQIRKGEKQEFEIHWGGLELLDDFYAVFSRNMRDLGTPVFGRSLFTNILKYFADAAEFCVLRHGKRPVACALLLHGARTTEVPSASSLREYNPLNANMFMYWQLLKRAVERQQDVFDFGRSTIDGPTHKFKKQWGSLPHPAVWQFYLRQGSPEDLRPDSGKFGLAIRAWQKLPLFLANGMGPWIVKGIP